MDAKDLRTETVQGERNDGSKYSQSGVALQCNRNKSYQDIGSNPLAKTQPPVRPCAVIGPGVPPPAPNDAYLKKGPVELWPYPDNTYPRPPEYPHKQHNNVNPTRNISPRQTFQENMQRIMVAPTYSAVKHIDDSNSSQVQDQSAALSKHAKQTIPTEAKYCDVPYPMNLLTNEHKTIRETEMCVPSVNSPLTQTPSNGWPPSSNLHPMRTYGAHDIYQYPQYPSCAGPRPPVMPMGRPHRAFTEEAGYFYPDSYYQDASVRFKPYPHLKERYPHQSRYEYIGNYSNPFHPPPYAPNKYDIPNTRTSHPYPGYPHLKYVDNRVPDSSIEGYQMPNQQTINHNMQFRNQVIHPTYTPTLGTMQNKVLCYTPNISGKPSNKSSLDNKTYDYENSKVKYPVTDNYFVNELTRVHHTKNTAIPNYASPSLHAVPMPQYHRKDMPIKPFEYMTHYKHFEPPIGFNPLGHHLPEFSPNTLAISPTDSNTSNDTTHGTSHEDCGYVSQSSTTSVRSVDSANRIPNDFYRRYDYRYRPIVASSPMLPKAEAKTKESKKIDVRQFLSMWNEDEDNSANGSTKEMATPIIASDPNSYTKRHEIAGKSQDQLYVLGLVNVPNEELAKYEHIQKISKLPDNIKGYNSIELLNQFEEVIESSNLNSIRSSATKEHNTAIKDRKNSKPVVEVLPRPISPLDVEAKISQSVIHKEVGCNFEIKPCSPKMMNAEIAAPVQYLGERVIEKISNPLSNKPKSSPSIRVDATNIPTIQRQESTHSIYENPSCKMVGSPFTTNNIESAKNDYSLQDLETSSGVCLASLPRLDNEIELNFPEVNQQFINANKVDHGVLPEYTQEVAENNMESKVFKNDTKEISEIKSMVSLSEDTATVVTRLSKYRKTKINTLESLEDESTINAARTDSVIIENPENVRKIEDNNYFNRIMKDGEEQKPINLTSQNDLHLNIQHKEPQSVIECALDFSLSKSDNGLHMINDNYDEITDITQEKPAHDNVPMVECFLKDGNEIDDNILKGSTKTVSSESVLYETHTKSIIVRNKCEIKFEDDSVCPSAKSIDSSLDSPKKSEENAKFHALLNESVSVLTSNTADRTNFELKMNTDKIHSEDATSTKVIVVPKNKSDTENKSSNDLINDCSLHNNIHNEDEMQTNDSQIDISLTPDILIQNNRSAKEFKNTDTDHMDTVSQKSSVFNHFAHKYDETTISVSDHITDKDHEQLKVDCGVERETKTVIKLSDLDSVSKTQEYNKLDNSTPLILDQTNKYCSKLISGNELFVDRKLCNDSECSEKLHDNLSPRVNNASNDLLDLPISNDGVLQKSSTENQSEMMKNDINTYNENLDKSADLPISIDCVLRKSDLITLVSTSDESVKNDQIVYNQVLETNEASTSLSKNCHNNQWGAEHGTVKNEESEIKSFADTRTDNIVNVENDTIKSDKSEMKSVVDIIIADVIEVANGNIQNDETKIKSVGSSNLVEVAAVQKPFTDHTRSDDKVNFTSCNNSDVTPVQIISSTDSKSRSVLTSDLVTLTERNHSIDSGYHSNKSSFVAPDNCEDIIDVSENLKTFEDIVFEPLEQEKEISNDCVISEGNDKTESTSDTIISGKSSKNESSISMLNFDIMKKQPLCNDIQKNSKIGQTIKTAPRDRSMKIIFEKTLKDQLGSTEVLNMRQNNDSFNNGLGSEICDSNINIQIEGENSFHDQLNDVAECEKSHENSELVKTLEIGEPCSRSLKEDLKITEVMCLKQSYRFRKELCSPWIQNLCMFTEGKISKKHKIGAKFQNDDCKLEKQNGPTDQETISDIENSCNADEKCDVQNLIGTEENSTIVKESYTYSNECHTMSDSELVQDVRVKSYTEYGTIRSELNTKLEDNVYLSGKSSFHSSIDASENNLDQSDSVDNLNKTNDSVDQEKIPDMENSCIADEECDVHNLIGTEKISFRYSNNSITSQISEKNFEKGSSFQYYSEDKQKINDISQAGQFDDPPPINHRQRLKRAFSDSSLNMRMRMDRDENNTNNYNIWPPKRNRFDEFENFIPNNRRNSVNIEENVSFCILIDDNCIITEDNEEKICIAELPEDYITEIDTVIDEDNFDAIVELDTCSRDQHVAKPVISKYEEENPLETWVEDIACAETIFSGEVAENVIISAPSSPTESASEYEYCESYNIGSCNERNEEYTYGESIFDCENQIEDTIYNTDHREINKTLLFGQEIAEYRDNSGCETDIQLELSDDWKQSLKNTPDYIDQTHTSNDFSLETPENKENIFVKKLSPLRKIDDYLDNSSAENETEQLARNDLELSNITQNDPVSFDESSLDDTLDYKMTDKFNTLSSSTEVSSTTSEGKKSGILLKITNLNGSKVSQINGIEPNKRPRCKFTEKKEYLASDLNFPNRPLITKAAQKYIPPIKESIKELKVQIKLPQQRLLTLKQLKITRNEPKVQKQNNVILRVAKKVKPNFDDVLKSIDEVQIKIHKEKSKKAKTIVPKVVIKKNQNGSHYASTPKKDTFNPDLTGRKWQPWVFLEKNNFIDKMAISNKFKAIFSHRKQTYVLTEKFKKYKSVSNTKFIISQPKSNDASGKLKYTIRLKH